jgi:hypothetical protein
MNNGPLLAARHSGPITHFIYQSLISHPYPSISIYLYLSTSIYIYLFFILSPIRHRPRQTEHRLMAALRTRRVAMYGAHSRHKAMFCLPCR